MLYVVPMSYFCWSVLRKGTPALRHDWLWPLERAGLLGRIADLSTGWFSEGFGHANAYPMTYPVMWGLTPIVLAFGSRAALLALLLLIGFCGVAAAERIALHFEAGRVTAFALALFLLFNPWTYNKIVAGHLTQTLAYLGLAFAVLELLEERLRARGLALGLIVAALQLQLFFFAAALTCTRIGEGAARRALLAGLVVFSPTLLGVALDRWWLLSLPFTIPWEDQQSVPLQAGVALGGYFVHYADRAFDGAPGWGVLVFAALAAAAPFLLRSRGLAALGSLAALTLLFVTGTTWWLAAFWRWAILNAPAIGVFREMYDLIALVAVVYAVLAGATLGRISALRWPALACALLVACAWLPHPPADYWVASETLPAPGPRLAHAVRYALMPPFQPLTYEGSGSGADPLYAGRAPDRAAANALLALYPENRALADYWVNGDSSRLAQLGVGVIECRRGFDEAPGSVLYGHVRGAAEGVCRSDEIPLPDAAPTVALEREVRACSLCARVGDGGVFFGDEGSGRFRTIPPEREFIDPTQGWVDARLVFPTNPSLAQGIGGSFTTQAKRPLRLPPGPEALVDVRGSLTDERGRTVARNTEGYRWIALPPGAVAVTCRGACLVAGVGAPGNIPLERPPAPKEALPSKTLAAWIVTVDLPSGRSGLLRSLTSYDPGWAAFRPGDRSFLRHLRIDAAFNGWIVTGEGPARVWLFHLPSLLQALAGLAGAACALVVLALRVQDVLQGQRVARSAEPEARV